jgi:hypothetical protein
LAHSSFLIPFVRKLLCCAGRDLNFEIDHFAIAF